MSGLALIGLVALTRLEGQARRYAIAATAWILGLEIFYRAVGVPFAPWYHVASFNAGLALAAAGGVGLFRAGSVASVRQLRWAFRPLATALAATVLASTASFYLGHWGSPPDPRIRIYRDIALALKERSAPDARVAAVEIGALAFFGDRPVVDLVGLVDPRMLAARRANRVAEGLAASPPDFLVDNPNFHATFLEPLIASGELERRYRLVASFSRPEYPVAVRLLERIDRPQQ